MRYGHEMMLCVNGKLTIKELAALDDAFAEAARRVLKNRRHWVLFGLSNPGKEQPDESNQPRRGR